MCPQVAGNQMIASRRHCDLLPWSTTFDAKSVTFSAHHSDQPDCSGESPISAQRTLEGLNPVAAFMARIMVEIEVPRSVTRPRPIGGTSIPGHAEHGGHPQTDDPCRGHKVGTPAKRGCQSRHRHKLRMDHPFTRHHGPTNAPEMLPQAPDNSDETDIRRHPPAQCRETVHRGGQTLQEYLKQSFQPGKNWRNRHIHCADICRHLQSRCDSSRTAVRVHAGIG